MGRRARQDSVQGRIEAEREAKRAIPVPDGVELPTPEHKMVWKQFVAARSAKNWRTFDLVMLGTVVDLEVQIRQQQIKLAGEELIVPNRFGVDTICARFDVIERLRKQQLQIVKTLSLGVRADRAAEINESSVVTEEETPGQAVVDLLAA